MGRRIEDAVAQIPGLTRQRRWQLRQQAKGRCIVCGRKALTRKYCRRHRDIDATQRARLRASLRDSGAAPGSKRGGC